MIHVNLEHSAILRTLFFLTVGGLSYGMAWVQQEINHKERVCAMHMRARKISTLVFEELLPAFERSADVRERMEFFRESKDVVPSYIIDDALEATSDNMYKRWYDKWYVQKMAMKRISEDGGALPGGGGSKSQ